jgi:hypothetical protein
MKLYHASKHKFETIKRSQARHPDADGFNVPESELQNKIYFTPSLGFALAMAAGPDGMTSLRDDTISFEHADEFDLEREVYVYEIDSEGIASDLIEEVDGEQMAIDMDEIVPVAMHEFKAGEVFNYYEHVEWKPPSERKKEMKFI